jgi:hypothetical protein
MDVFNCEYIGSTSIRGGKVFGGFGACGFCDELGIAMEFRADNE